MSSQPPNKPVRRAVVPKVSKEISSGTLVLNRISTGTNLLLLLITLILGAVVYFLVFKKDTLTTWFNLAPTEKSVVKKELNTSEEPESTDENSEENGNEVSTFIGDDDFVVDPENGSSSSKEIVYPKGSTLYLVMGTFVFKPYAIDYNTKLKNEGYKSGILTSGTDRKYYRVYIASSKDVNAIRKKRDELRTSKGLNAWIYAE